MPWPPQVGDLLPRYDETIGIEEKLRTYSLAIGPEECGPKANGFQKMLGIDLGSIDHLERQIRVGIATTPISSVRRKASGAIHCAVQFQIAGPDRYSHRTASLRTTWELIGPLAPPRMTNAYLRGKEHR
jgi:hypothetical protein